jgi:hypothetical protein
MVRSASGHEQIRYRTQLTLRIGGKKIRALFNLSDRSRNRFPVLIGRRTISGKFVVDVSQSKYNDEGKVFAAENQSMNTELNENPYEFYKKHYKKAGVSLRKRS